MQKRLMTGGMRSRKTTSQSHGVGHEKERSACLPGMMERSNNSEDAQKFMVWWQEVKGSDV